MMAQDQLIDVPMNKQKLIIRNDDFDFRMLPEFYIAVHEYFIANDLIETAVIQITQHGRMPNYEAKKEIIEYMNTAPNWDLQIHCWAHDRYQEMSHNEIIRDMSAALFHFQRLFNRLPTTWFPPHNAISEEMETAARELGLVINNESCGIKDFVKLAKEGVVETNSLYFHGWRNEEMEYFEEMIKLAKEVVYGTPEV